METLWQDVRFGLRTLAKSPGFALVAVLSLALGIGVNSSMFSLVDAALLRSLPVHRPEELVTVETRTAEGGLHADFSYPLFRTLREIDQDVAEIFAFADDTLGASTGEITERVRGEYVSANYFAVLGVRPQLGSAFTSADEKPGAQQTAVISDALWRRFFAGSSGVVGRTLRINGRPFEVVGVAPRNFRGMVRGRPSEVWITLPQYGPLSGEPGILSLKNTSWMLLAGRLRPGVSAAQAQSAMTARLPEGFEEARGAGVWQAVVTPAPIGSLYFLQGTQEPLLLLFGAVGLVLLIACANVAILLLARSRARQKEIGIRIALGASRLRLVRQLLTEGVLLSLAGGALGLLFALWTTDLAAFARSSVGVDLNVNLDTRVLGFTLAASMMTALVFGIVPALRATHVDVVPVLKDSGSAPPRRGLPSLRNLLVVAQVTLSLVLLVGAGLFLRSLLRLQSVDTGIRAEKVLAMSLDVRLQGYDQTRGQNFYSQLLERARSLPGVQLASLASSLPATSSGRRMQRLENDTRPPVNEKISIDIVTIAPRFFETIGLPLLRGRDFRALDAPGTAPVTIVNETMASKFWPQQDPVGRTFFDGVNTFEVVGVARNTKYRSLREAPRMTMYVPLSQAYRQRMDLLVSTDGAPAGMISAVRRQVRQLDAAFPVYNVRTLPEHVGRSLFLERAQALLLSAFGFLALLLAAVGTYGVMGYTVAQRTREMGIRMALGAQRADVLKLVLRTGLLLAVCGIGAGLLGAIGLGRLVASQLYGVGPLDPVSLTAGSAILLGITLLAAYFPARRAARVDPLVALRYE